MFEVPFLRKRATKTVSFVARFKCREKKNRHQKREKKTTRDPKWYVTVLRRIGIVLRMYGKYICT